MDPEVLLAEREILAEWVLLAHLEYLECQEFLECLDPLDHCLKYSPSSIRFRCHRERTRGQIPSPTCRLRWGQWVLEALQASAAPRGLRAVLDPRESTGTEDSRELRGPRGSEEAGGCLAGMESPELTDCLEERGQMVLLEAEVCLEFKECLD